MSHLNQYLKLPAEIQARILILPMWKEPPNFRTMNQHERYVLRGIMTNAYPVAPEPTQTNHWVWFGSYPPPRHMPQHRSKGVTRILYKHFIGDPGTKRLVDRMSESISDVNPFQYLTGHSQRFLGPTQTPSLDASNPLIKQQIDACVLALTTNWQLTDSDDDLRMYLVPEGFPPTIIDAALPIWRAKHGPQSQPTP